MTLSLKKKRGFWVCSQHPTGAPTHRQVSGGDLRPVASDVLQIQRGREDFLGGGGRESVIPGFSTHMCDLTASVGVPKCTGWVMASVAGAGASWTLGTLPWSQGDGRTSAIASPKLCPLGATRTSVQDTILSISVCCGLVRPLKKARGSKGPFCAFEWSCVEMQWLELL